MTYIRVYVETLDGDLIHYEFGCEIKDKFLRVLKFLVGKTESNYVKEEKYVNHEQTGKHTVQYFRHAK